MKRTKIRVNRDIFIYRKIHGELMTINLITVFRRQMRTRFYIDFQFGCTIIVKFMAGVEVTMNLYVIWNRIEFELR